MFFTLALGFITRIQLTPVVIMVACWCVHSAFVIFIFIHLDHFWRFFFALLQPGVWIRRNPTASKSRLTAMPRLKTKTRRVSCRDKSLPMTRSVINYNHCNDTITITMPRSVINYNHYNGAMCFLKLFHDQVKFCCCSVLHGAVDSLYVRWKFAQLSVCGCSQSSSLTLRISAFFHFVPFHQHNFR
jgi:hypothetical protein